MPSPHHPSSCYTQVARGEVGGCGGGVTRAHRHHARTPLRSRRRRPLGGHGEPLPPVRGGHVATLHHGGHHRHPVQSHAAARGGKRRELGVSARQAWHARDSNPTQLRDCERCEYKMCATKITSYKHFDAIKEASQFE